MPRVKNLEEGKILIAEDENLVADSLKVFLTKTGYDVLAVVPSGEEAIRLAGDKKPDLVLMDINLAGRIDGVDAARVIYATYNVPIIFLTAHSEDEMLERVKEANPYGYILKPFVAAELKSAILLAMHRHKSESEINRKIRELEDANKQLKARVVDDDTDMVRLKNNFEYHKPSHTLYYKGDPIRLSKKELMLVHILVENRGKNVSFEKMFLFIWGDENTSVATLRSLLRRVRQNLPEDLITSIPNVGYRID